MAASDPAGVVAGVTALGHPPGGLAFLIPAVPPSVNVWSRQHWTARARLARIWHDWVLLSAGTRRKVKGPAIVTVTFYGRADADNSIKLVLDGLVRAGIITGDAWPHLVELRLRQRPGKPKRTEVVVEPLHPPLPKGATP